MRCVGPFEGSLLGIWNWFKRMQRHEEDARAPIVRRLLENENKKLLEASEAVERSLPSETSVCIWRRLLSKN